MNLFGELADELTDLIEQVEGCWPSPETEALVRALHRAFVEACKADRALEGAKGTDCSLRLEWNRGAAVRTAEVIVLHSRGEGDEGERGA